MIDEYVVKHYEHVSTRSFEEVVNAFEAAVGDGDDGRFLSGMRALSNAEDWENLCKSSFGSSGFLHMLTFDHGHWLKFYEIGGKAKQYNCRNPLLAHTMVKHDIGVCFQVPFRILIYETSAGEARIAYDLPSILMARLHNDEVDDAACKIDPKVIAFVTELAGASA
jgi:uncharacterized protein (DUF302 family)